MSSRITHNPEQCGGKPCIRGMRIRERDILELYAAGESSAQILADFPDLEAEDLKVIAAAKGDSLYRLAGRYGTSTGSLRQDNPSLMQSIPYLVGEGDTLANLASRRQETVSVLRLFNPQLARYSASALLPAGVVIQLPAIGVADALAVGLPLLVPQVEPTDPLPVGGWVLLPPKQGVGGLAEL